MFTLHILRYQPRGFKMLTVDYGGGGGGGGGWVFAC